MNLPDPGTKELRPQAAKSAGMKKLFSLVALAFGCAASVAAPIAPLTSLKAIHQLSNAEASQALPVAFEATVGYARTYESLLFVEDGEAGIFVRSTQGGQYFPGDRLLVTGKTQASFRPLIVASDVKLLGHGAPPRAIPATFDELIRAQRDCVLVSVTATVHAADIVISSVAPMRSARLQLVTDGGHIEANVDTSDAQAIKGLLDADVLITGVAAGKFDDKMQQTGVVLYVSTLDNVEVLHRAAASPWSLPITPMDEVMAVSHTNNATPRVRVQGTITYYQPGSAIVLQNGTRSLWIGTHTREPLQVGDFADAVGFPEAHERVLSLSDGEIQDTHLPAPVAPLPATWHQLAYWSSNTADGHQNDLVSTEGVIVTQVREASQDEYILSSDGKLFTAIYHHPPPGIALPPMFHADPGARVRVSGICMIVDTSSITPGEEVPFNILMRTFDDIAVVAQPPLLNMTNLIRLVGILLLITFAAGIRGWVLERKVRRQTAALASRIEAEAALERRMAQLEKRRGQILEDINNGDRPLIDTLEEIAQLVSLHLEGARVWCETGDGCRPGDCPATLEEFRIVSETIHARAGSPLGTIFAAFDPASTQNAAEVDALTAGARLATLAIETRRLYSDLLHRSEFDMLTDLHNRFSLEKRIEALIEGSTSKESPFGLIYIDLDGFKQVNDLYGHQVGDLYLQKVAMRMKCQLRTDDMLARVGGDEFAALVPVIRGRSDVQEIALRLERCFGDPFTVTDHTLRGKASIGVAVFPEDATTKDALLITADAAMYVAKNNRQRPPQRPGKLHGRPGTETDRA